ncbi:MAG TPA: hypothetical protein VFM96_12520 [Gaiellaceae bacterium]|nr:hypothetical protein [Gaiellaceae bacterium]
MKKFDGVVGVVGTVVVLSIVGACTYAVLVRPAVTRFDWRGLAIVGAVAFVFAMAYSIGYARGSRRGYLRGRGYG